MDIYIVIETVAMEIYTVTETVTMEIFIVQLCNLLPKLSFNLYLPQEQTKPSDINF